MESVPSLKVHLLAAVSNLEGSPAFYILQCAVRNQKLLVHVDA